MQKIVTTFTLVLAVTAAPGCEFLGYDCEDFDNCDDADEGGDDIGPMTCKLRYAEALGLPGLNTQLCFEGDLNVAERAAIDSVLIGPGGEFQYSDLIWVEGGCHTKLVEWSAMGGNLTAALCWDDAGEPDWEAEGPTGPLAVIELGAEPPGPRDGPGLIRRVTHLNYKDEHMQVIAGIQPQDQALCQEVECFGVTEKCYCTCAVDDDCPDGFEGGLNDGICEGGLCYYD